MAGYLFSVDTGGTFTDIVGTDPAGRLIISKVPTTPPHFEAGVIAGLEKTGIDLKDVQLIVHGTTLGTNAVITKTGANCGLIGTKGFRDILEIRRANRPKEGLYDISWKPPEPLVPRRNRLTVEERVDCLGRVITPLAADEARRTVGILKKRGVEAIAVSFLNSFLNPNHEEEMARIIGEEYPGAFVTTSSRLIPVIREFERTATTVVNAYIGPIMQRYLGNLERRLRDKGYQGDILIMQSGGGVMTLQAARDYAVRTVKSGPAAGVLAAVAIGKAPGIENLISLDMGGTSADISAIYRGKVRMTEEWQVEFGVPIIFPSIDVITIGAGGGTIAWVDAGGVLKSGPRSAGAVPGPACYNNGGVEPTNTDAHLVLGNLSPHAFVGGDMALSPELAHRAVKGVAERLGMDVVTTAQGIIRVSNANMIKALRAATTERGYDPREFALLAFGGAGPLHATYLAKELKIAKVIIPRSPGVTSAMGLLFADIRHDFATTFIKRVDKIDPGEVEDKFREMEKSAHSRLEAEGIKEGERRFQRIINFKYYGGFEPAPLPIPIRPAPFTGEVLKEVISNFHTIHQREYGYALQEIPVQMELLRVIAYGPTPTLELLSSSEHGTARDALKGIREVYFEEARGFINTNIYSRERFLPGARVEGPAIIEQMDSTTVIPPGTRAEVDEYLNLILEVR